jgi:hypothetical protein
LKLHAVFIGKRVKELLDSADRHIFKVHSVFHRVVNLKTPCGMIAVALGEVGRSPAYVTVSEDVDFSFLGIEQGMECKVYDGEIRFIDKFTVDLKRAVVWEGILDRKLFLGKHVLYENISALKSTADRHATHGSGWRRIFNNPERDFIQRVRGLNCSGDLSLMEFSIHNLIGYGLGLTPTGDDILLGFLGTVNYLLDYDPIRHHLYEKILLNLHKTNDISSSFLKSAVKGDYHEYLERTIYSIISGTAESVVTSTMQLLKIGATSGSDIVAGLYLGFLGTLNHNSNRCN